MHEQLESAYARLAETAAELDTLIIRAEAAPLPEFTPLPPDLLASAAAAPSAPPELRAVAAAVAAGRTSWEEVVSGGGLDVPEIRELQQAGADQLVRALTRQDPPPAAVPAEEDFSERTILRKDSW